MEAQYSTTFVFNNLHDMGYVTMGLISIFNKLRQLIFK